MKEICTKHFLERAQERIGNSRNKVIKDAYKIVNMPDARDVYDGETRKWFMIKYVIDGTVDKIVIHERHCYIIRDGLIITLIPVPEDIIPENDIKDIKYFNEVMFSALQEIKENGYTKARARKINIVYLHRLVGKSLGESPSKKACIDYAIRKYIDGCKKQI